MTQALAAAAEAAAEPESCGGTKHRQGGGDGVGSRGDAQAAIGGGVDVAVCGGVTGPVGAAVGGDAEAAALRRWRAPPRTLSSARSSC
jgi:hypothetical protein